MLFFSSGLGNCQIQTGVPINGIPLHLYQFSYILSLVVSSPAEPFYNRRYNITRWCDFASAQWPKIASDHPFQENSIICKKNFYAKLKYSKQ